MFEKVYKFHFFFLIIEIKQKFFSLNDPFLSKHSIFSWILLTSQVNRTIKYINFKSLEIMLVSFLVVLQKIVEDIVTLLFLAYIVPAHRMHPLNRRVRHIICLPISERLARSLLVYIGKIVVLSDTKSWLRFDTRKCLTICIGFLGFLAFHHSKIKRESQVF